MLYPVPVLTKDLFQYDDPDILHDGGNRMRIGEQRRENGRETSTCYSSLTTKQMTRNSSYGH